MTTRGLILLLAIRGTVVFLVVMVLVLPAVTHLSATPGNTPDASELHQTGDAVVLLWALGWPMVIDSIGLRGRQRFYALDNRIVFTLGCIACLFHIALVFHTGFAWSHQKAFEHVERGSGVGAGVFVSYLFALVWTVDVVWAWVALDQYLNRPLWIGWVVLGFMGFVVFNAGVVFGSGNVRWLFLLLFLPAGALTVLQWRQARASTPPSERG